MSRGERIKNYLRLHSNENRIYGMEINCMPPTGDCFYYAVEYSLLNNNHFSSKRQDNIIDISYLREIVSNSLTMRIYNNYLLYYESNIEGYEFMSNISSLDTLKNIISKTSKQIQRKLCIWADHFAVQSISNHFSICFLIFNEQNTISKTIIFPNDSKESYINGFIILYLTRRNHYNLIGFKVNSLHPQYYFKQNEIPKCIYNTFLKDIKLTKNTQKHKEENKENEYFNLLSDSFLLWFFNKYFTINEQKYILSNVCDRFGKIIWYHYKFPSLFKQNKQKTSGKTYIKQKSLIQPKEYLNILSKRIPHIRRLISSIEIDYFQRGWISDILSLQNLKEFYFYYNNIQKYHLPNPDLKQLVKTKGKTLLKLKIQPLLSNNLCIPIKFSNCGFNSLKHCKYITHLSFCIHSDIKNTLLKHKFESLIHLELYNCSNLTIDIFEKFIKENYNINNKRIINIILYDCSFNNNSINYINDTYHHFINLKISNNLLNTCNLKKRN